MHYSESRVNHDPFSKPDTTFFFFFSSFSNRVFLLDGESVTDILVVGM